MVEKVIPKRQIRLAERTILLQGCINCPCHHSYWNPQEGMVTRCGLHVEPSKDPFTNVGEKCPLETPGTFDIGAVIRYG